MIKIIFIAIAIAAFGFFPLLGLPGVLVMYAAKPTTNIIFGSLAWEAWNRQLGDRIWPLAIMLSFIWPVFIPLAYYWRLKLLPGSNAFGLQPIAVFVGTVLAGVVLLGQAAVILSGPVKRLTREEIVETAVAANDLGMMAANYLPEGLGQFKKDPLSEAIFGNKLELAKFLIDKRHDFDRYVPAGDQMTHQFATPLHTAVSVGSVPLVRILLEKGANPNVVNALGQAPLHALSWDPQGDGEVLRLLKRHRADFSAIDHDGNTPLAPMTSRILNSWDEMAIYARILIEGGVDPQFRNKLGRSALDYAKENGHDSTANVLEGLSRTEAP